MGKRESNFLPSSHMASGRERRLGGVMLETNMIALYLIEVLGQFRNAPGL